MPRLFYFPGIAGLETELRREHCERKPTGGRFSSGGGLESRVTTARGGRRVLPLLLKERMVHRAMRSFYFSGMAGLETNLVRTAAARCRCEERTNGSAER